MCILAGSGSGSGLDMQTCRGVLSLKNFWVTFLVHSLPILNTGMPVVPFVDFGSSDGTLRFVDDGGISVNLPSPPLQFGSATFTSAFVSNLMSDSFIQSLTSNAKN